MNIIELELLTFVFFFIVEGRTRFSTALSTNATWGPQTLLHPIDGREHVSHTIFDHTSTSYQGKNSSFKDSPVFQPATYKCAARATCILCLQFCESAEVVLSPARNEVQCELSSLHRDQCTARGWYKSRCRWLNPTKSSKPLPQSDEIYFNIMKACRDMRLNLPWPVSPLLKSVNN